MKEQIEKALESINHVILGKQKEVQEIMLAILSGGHVLLIDIPGVGKTTLANTFAKTCSDTHVSLVWCAGTLCQWL